MNLRRLDLNLLVIFDALVTERSINRAAEKVGLSASAVSHALRRLRDTFRDELLERTPEGMVPTRRALDLHRRVQGGLVEIGRAIDQQLNFEPRTSERTFKLRVADHFVACLLPSICIRVRAEAPNITLIVEYPGDEPRRQEPGEIQLRICANKCDPEYNQRRLMRCAFAVAMRRGHAAAAAPMTVDQMVSLPYVRTSNASIGPSLIDAALALQGKSRRVMLTVPALSAIFPIVAHSDMCAILPERWVELYGQSGKITTVPLPLPDLQFTEDMIWQKADDADAGHRWLRRVIEEQFSVLYSPDGGMATLLGAEPDLLGCIPVKLPGVM
jgi:DNA-binding transcriptional LysR family regulator